MTGARSRWRRLSMAGALALFLAPAARSEPAAGGPQTSVTIEGEVQDAAGLPVSEAAVTVRNTLTGASQQQMTDRKLRQPTPVFNRLDYGRTFRVGLRYSFTRERS
jgi:hypothetical protein